jgi:hypothetical protein
VKPLPLPPVVVGKSKKGKVIQRKKENSRQSKKRKKKKKREFEGTCAHAHCIKASFLFHIFFLF